MKLTMEGYSRFDPLQRVAFQRWLEENGLVRSFVFEADFGEGILVARCYQMEEDWDDDGPVEKSLTFPLRTPPPAFVRGFCERVRGSL